MGTERAKKGGEGGNRLGGEKSPYLRQHAENPVDWYPWSAEAFEKARAEDKPVLVSIGYSTCHWCHVMERESYEDQETAHLMNENFVNIKVDREERPDVDSLYMKAVQALGGQGGWPLNVFTTPDGAPFFGGTYWPPDDRFGMPSFKKILRAVSDTYRKDKTGVSSVTTELEEVLKRTLRPEKVDAGPALADRAAEAAGLYFDPINGGFGISTKFPHAMFLSFLLRYHGRAGSARALEIVRTSLAGMAMGGIYDHLGGGFHRYSVDERWEVPHFEKMLYDNALLIELYSEAWKATGAELFRDAASETIGYLLRDMRSPEGGFYAAQDADSEGREGKYYVWTTTEVLEVLGPEDGERFIEYFSLTDEGNYEGANTLRINRGASEEVVPVDAEMKALAARLFEARAKRVPPDTDRKVITAWNGLAVKALVTASAALGGDDYLEAAKGCARFILDRLRDGEGRLHRYYLDGPSTARGNLEDYSVLGEALVALHSSDRDKDGGWLDEALALADRMAELFAVEGEPLLFDTPIGDKGLFVRERDLHDTDLPSGNSAAAGFLLAAGRASGRDDLAALALEILGSVEGMAREPLVYGHLLCVLEDYLAGEGG